MREIAKKNDNSKPDLSLLPSVALEAMSRALMFGENKYGRYNYCNGFESHRLVAACLRHVTAWQDGEDNDPESGGSHLGHALASLAMLLHTIQLGTNKDTRRGKGEKALPVHAPLTGPAITTNLYPKKSVTDYVLLDARNKFEERCAQIGSPLDFIK